MIAFTLICPRDWEIFRKYQSGTPQRALQKQFRITGKTLRAILRAAAAQLGEPLRVCQPRRSNDVVPSQLVVDFLEGKLTVQDIAARLGWGSHRVRRVLKRQGVSLRAAYGTRLAKIQARPTTCRHCGGRVTRSRGLCWSCYTDRTIREKYSPLEMPGNQRGSHADFNAATKLPEPTTALPGTPEYKAVLAERAAAGLALHHPKDARRDLS